MNRIIAGLILALFCATAQAQQGTPGFYGTSQNGGGGGGGGGGSGTVTSVATSCGLTGGTITTSGTISGTSVVGNNGSFISGSTYTVQGTTATHPDCGATLVHTGSTATTVTVAQAGSTGFATGFGFAYMNASTQSDTIDFTTSTLLPGNVSSIVVPPNTMFAAQADGANGNWELMWASAGLAGEIPDCHGSSNALLFNGTTKLFSCNTISGSGGITFTDGTHTVSNATQLTVTGGTVGGTSPNATLSISGSSGLTVGSTTISGGTNGNCEYNNSGVLGEQPCGNGVISTPGYVTNDWYFPYMSSAVAGTGTALVAGTTYCAPGVIQQTLHIAALLANIGTPDSGGNIQLAVYATGSFGRPSGNALVQSSSISTTSGGTVTGTVTSTSFPAGTYWFCSQADNTTVNLKSINSGTSLSGVAMVGSATSTNVGNLSISGISVAGTFGTWPNLTSGTSWADVTSNKIAIVGFNVGSVP